MSWKVDLRDRVTHQKIGEINDIRDPLIREEINGIFEFDFAAPLTSETKNIRESVIIDVNGIWFNIAQIIMTRREIRFECEHVSYDANRFYLNIQEIEDTAENIFRALLDQKGNFRAGRIELSEPQKIYYFAQHQSNLRSALIELANLVGGELIFNNYEVSLVQQRGKNNNQTIKLGDNLVDISINRDVLGVEDKSIEIEIIDLSKVENSEELDEVELGDTIQIQDNIIGINESSRIVYIEYNPFQKINPTVTVGKVQRDIIDYMHKKDEIEEDEEKENYYLESFKIGEVDCLQLNNVNIDNDNVLPDGITASLNFLKREQHRGLDLKLKSEFSNYHLTVFIEDIEGNVTTYDWATQKEMLQAMQFPSENMATLSVMVTSTPYAQFDYLTDDLQQFGVKFERQFLDVLREFRIGDVNCLKLNDVALVYESNLPDDITAEVPYLDPLTGLFIVPKREFKYWYIKVITYDSNNVATEYNWSDIKGTAKEWTLPNENISKIAIIVDEKPPNEFDDSKHLRQIYGVRFFQKEPVIEPWLEEFRIGDIDCLNLDGVQLKNNATKDDIVAQISYEKRNEFVGLFLNLKEEYADYTITVTLYLLDSPPDGYSFNWDEIKDLMTEIEFPMGAEGILITVSNQNNEKQVYGIKFVQNIPQIPQIFKGEFRDISEDGFIVYILDENLNNTYIDVNVLYKLELPYEIEFGDTVLVVDNVIVGKIMRPHA